MKHWHSESRLLTFIRTWSSLAKAGIMLSVTLAENEKVQSRFEQIVLKHLITLLIVCLKANTKGEVLEHLHGGEHCY